MLSYSANCARRRAAKERREVALVWGVGAWVTLLLVASRVWPS